MEFRFKIPAFILTSYVIAFALMAAMASPVPSELPSDSNHNMALINLGEVGGKSFFISLDLTMNWTDTKRYCEIMNLKLVSIETKEEADFLVEKLRPYGIHWFYSSLHESISPQMMEWDETRSQPDISFLGRWGWWNVANEYQYCGMFRAQDVFDSLYLYAVRCNYEAFVACQL